MSEKKGFFGRAFDDMKENAAKQKEIDQANREAIKQDNRELREALKNYKADDMKEFKEADGLVGKAKVVASHMERDGKAQAESNRKDYEKMLEEQRKNIKDITNKYNN